jgi:hypothetical protein
VETQFCLESAYKLYLTYREEKGFISHDTVLDQYNVFYQQLRNLVVEQNVRANHGRGYKAINVNYLQIIRSLYRDKRFCLVQNIKDFEAKEHDGLVLGDYLYLRRDKLMVKIKTFEASADFDDVLKSLKIQRALKTGKDSNSRKIGGSRLRFYAIPLNKLQ